MDSSGLPAPLPRHWAFVIQLRRGSGFTAETLSGRVEHIVSGQATTFSALHQLLAFMEQALSRGESGDEE